VATGNEKLSFPIGVPVETNAVEASDALEQLRARVQAGEQALKEMAGANRRLRGSTDEVKAAKEQLKAKIEAERQAISAAQLGMLKAGTSYDQLSAKAKKLGADQGDLQKKLAPKTIDELKDRTKGLSAAVSAAGGPVASLKGRMEQLKEIMGGGGGAMNLAALAAAGLVAALVAVTAAAGAAAFSFAKFVLGAANAARTAGLMREAAYGGMVNAERLGDHIEQLSRKVHTSKTALNEMTNSLALAGVGGQTLIDTLNAVAQADAAVGAGAAATLRSLVERGRLTQRFVLNPLELQGTGVGFDDIAKSLSKSMNVGVNDAKRALLSGRVSLEAGAKALRGAVEEKFAGINLRRLSDLNVLAEKFKERLASLAKDVGLEKLGTGLQRLLALFDDSTVTGAALKQIVTLLGNGLVKALVASLPLVRALIIGMTVGTINVILGLLKLKKSFEGTFGKDLLGKVDLVTAAFDFGRKAVVAVAIGVAVLAAAIGLALAPFIYFGAKVWEVFSGLYDLVVWADGKIRGVDWKATGRAIVEGIRDGIKAGGNAAIGAITGLGDDLKNAFKAKLEIHSPSDAFRREGKQIPAGTAAGIDEGADEANDAVQRMIRPSLPAGGGGGGGRAGGGLVYAPVFNLTVTGAGDDASSIAKAIRPAVRAELQRAFDELAAELGIPRVTPSFPAVPGT